LSISAVGSFGALINKSNPGEEESFLFILFMLLLFIGAIIQLATHPRAKIALEIEKEKES
jgi:hypothetical protein